MAYGIPVRRLQTEIDSREFSELLAYDTYIDPFGQEWRRNGVLCATVAGMVSKKVDPEDFMPIVKNIGAASSAATIKQQLKAFAKAHNAKQKK